MKRRRVRSLERTAVQLRLQTLLLKSIARGLVADPAAAARQFLEGGNDVKKEVRLVALPILAMRSGLRPPPVDPLALIAAHLEAQQALLEVIACGQVEDPAAEVREFFERVGTFTLKRVNLEPGSWPFDEAPPFDPSELLITPTEAADPTPPVPGQKPVVWN